MNSIRTILISISGKYLVVETPDSFGGKEYSRIDVINFLAVNSISVGKTASAFGASVVSGNTYSVNASSLTSQRQNTSNNLTIDIDAISGNAIQARSSGISSIANQRISIVYTSPISHVCRTVYFQSANAFQLHKMLRFDVAILFII